MYLFCQRVIKDFQILDSDLSKAKRVSQEKNDAEKMF